MTDTIVKIMVEVLNIFAIATKEIKQGRTSEHKKACSPLIPLIVDQKSFSKGLWERPILKTRSVDWTD